LIKRGSERTGGFFGGVVSAEVEIRMKALIDQRLIVYKGD